MPQEHPFSWGTQPLPYCSGLLAPGIHPCAYSQLPGLRMGHCAKQIVGVCKV